MAQSPAFRHIHCSSRYDRSAVRLESDLDEWMADSGLVTLTEVSKDARAATMREKGWGYYNARKSQGQDECGIAWKVEHWERRQAQVRKLNNRTFYRLNGKPAENIYAASVLLRRRDSGHRLLVSVSHLPSHVEGRDQWRTDTEKWQARKQAYLSSLKTWSTLVKHQDRGWRADGVLVVADWNLNLKEDWVRDLLRNHWGKPYRQAWRHFPTSGGSLAGGPQAPAGSPGQGSGDRIIDGSLTHGLRVEDHPVLLPRVASSDHRPYSEKLVIVGKAANPDWEDASGDRKQGKAWWGFGDYLDDEIYEVTRVTEESA